MVSNTESPMAARWPYPVHYGRVSSVDTEILVLGGGIAGCWAAIAAARKGMKAIIVEKGSTIHSGSAGSGIDHWQDAATNPASKVTPEELAQAIIESRGGYINGITRYIKCRESYDTLLELEKMGMKIRDNADEFKGADFRDEATKLLFSYNYRDRYVIRIWGTAMKPVLYRECKRLGVRVFDRVMATSLLTVRGQPGVRVVGATGVNVRTGEFVVFKAKATVLSTASASRVWQTVDAIGTSAHRPPANSGDGLAMAWRAGARFTLMENSEPGTGSGVGMSSAGSAATWFACTQVDANGKVVPWFDRDGRMLKTVEERYQPAPDQKYFLGGGRVGSSNEFSGPRPMPEPELQRRVRDGEFTPPFYADLPSMPDHERKAIFGLMVGQEGLTWIGYRILTRAGFDPNKDMLQVYPRNNLPNVRSTNINGGGLVVDWHLRTNLEGLYAAGEQVFCTLGAAGSSTTGNYAGRQASKYATTAPEPAIDSGQVEREKERVLVLARRERGTDWKDLEDGVAKIMQDYCGDIKNDESLSIGLKWLSELNEGEARTVRGGNPHELMRALESLNIVTVAEIIVRSSIARKASSQWNGFFRSDYTAFDPPEWHKFITIALRGMDVEIGELPINYGAPLKENYEKNCVK